MKNELLNGKDVFIAVLTDRKEFSKAIQKTLAHVYPGVEVETYGDLKKLPEHENSIAMLDISLINGSPLDHALEQIHDRPTILIARDFASVRSLSKYLSSRISIITEEDISGMGLIQATHHLLERQKLHQQLRRTSLHLKELAIRDELTGFFNNRHFHELLTGEIKKSNRYKRPLGLVIISIKNLSTINKSLGHSEGDRAIAKSANAIRGTIRDVDIPSRYGDNEFAIILPEATEEGARVVAKRIQEDLMGIELEMDGEEIKPVLSCGIAALSPSIKTKEDLLRTALGALLEAKKNGEGAIFTSSEIEDKRRVVRENRQLIEQLNERIGRITKEAQKNYFQSLMMAIGEIPILKKLLMPHSERVAFFARRLAEAYGLDEQVTKAIYRAGLLHDAGKLAIDTAILTKPDRLTLAEQELMQRHPVFAIQIVGTNPFLNDEMTAVLHHHERFDGNGYPERLSGDSIPISARIIGIAEAWDVMTNAQPYRHEPLTLDGAMQEIRKGSGQQFDPDLVDCFNALVTG